MRLDDLPDELCEWCQGSFTPARGRIDQRFCCPEHRRAWENASRRHPPVTKSCPHCREPFVTTRPNHQKYCSEQCRMLHNRAFSIAVSSEERRRARAGRKCRYCGEPFEAKRSDQVFCSHICGVTYRHEQDLGYRPAEKRAALRCRCCGTPIEGARRTDVRYCEPCRKAKKNEASRLYKRRMRATLNVLEREGGLRPPNAGVH